MIKETKVTTFTEIVESDDGKQRYTLKKVWDKKKPLVTVLTLYPTIAGYIKSDLTMMLITNNVYDNGFGGFYSVNLYSEKIMIKQEKSYFTDDFNDTCIVECAKKSEMIIFAQGNLPNKNKKVKKRLDDVISILKKEGLANKIHKLTDKEKKICYHPLASKVRKKWIID